MGVSYLPSAAKALLRIGSQRDRDAIIARLEVIGMDPQARHGASVKALKGDPKGRLRLRMGDFRAIFRVEGGGIVVIAIGNRKDIYE